MRHRLEKDPKDFVANFNLGAVLLSRLDASGAVGPLETAVAAEPSRPEARNMLGVALQSVGRFSEAAAEFEIALKLRPDFTVARMNLADLEIRAGKLDEGIADLRLGVAADPENERLKERLQEALKARGR